MNTAEIIEKTAAYVKTELEGEGTGHDWWHIVRVWNTAKHIAEKENVNRFIVEMGALLHDIADHKHHNGDYAVGKKKTLEWLSQFDNITEDTKQHIASIVENTSFSKEKLGLTNFESQELYCVRDADRLDALGPIGIARAFAYGGKKGRPLYDPTVPTEIDPNADYIPETESTVHHFYSKLLLLEDRITTHTGKKLAASRTEFIKDYLKAFLNQWHGRDIK